jgi:hypothetical protein
MNKISEAPKADSQTAAGPRPSRLRQDSPFPRNTASLAPKRLIPPDSIDCAGPG